MPSASPSPFDRISQWLADGNLPAAEAYWLKRAKGDRVPARFVEVAAKVAEQDGRWEDALARWQRCAAMEPERRTVLMGQARALVQLQRWTDARDTLNQQLDREPDRLAAHELAARVAMQLGQLDAARQHWLRAAHDPRFVRPAALALMDLYEQAGETELAAQQALTLLDQPRLQAPVLKSMVKVTRSAGCWAAAVTLLERLLALEPTSQRHRLALAQCQLALRDFEAARVGLDAAELLPPGLPAWQVASQVLRGQADEAFLTAYTLRASAPVTTVASAGSEVPSVPQVVLLLELAADARVALLQQVAAQAEAGHAPAPWQQMVQLALAAAQGQPLVAPPAATATLPATQAVGVMLLARLQQQAGEFSAALATLQGLDVAALAEAWGDDPCQRQVLTVRHACAVRLGDLAAAQAALDQGLAGGLDRNWAAARALDLSLHGRGLPEAAAKWAGETPLAQWQRPFARQDHALALAGSGQATYAVAQLQARLDLRPDDDDARMALVGVLQGAGDAAGALAALNPVWQRDGLRPLVYDDARQVLLPGGVSAVGTAPLTPDGPLVSVVMTLRPGQAHLLPSLRSVLAQSWRQLELVLVALGWDDEAAAALRADLGHDARVQWLPLAGGTGVPQARNLAAQQAAGNLLWFSDADAWWHLDALATQVAALADHPQWLACRHSTLRVDVAGRVQFRPERPMQPGGLSALLMRREVWELLGGFDEVARGYNAEYLQRMVRTLGRARVGDVLAPLRLTTLHPGSVAAGADLPAHWFGHDPAVDRYLHAARRWLNTAALQRPVLPAASDSSAASAMSALDGGRPFPLPQDL
jgi:tetratricopeptide (TPR) repeat protein